MMDVLLYGFKDKYLEGSLILCPLVKTTVLGSPLGHLTSPVIGS